MGLNRRTNPVAKVRGKTLSRHVRPYPAATMDSL